MHRLNFELWFKLKLRQSLHSDTADRLHLMCCNAQKSKESLRALLHAKKLQKHTVEPGLVPEKLDTILTQPRKKGIRAKMMPAGAPKYAQKHPLAWKNAHASLNEGWLPHKRQENPMKLGSCFAKFSWRVAEKASVTVEILQGNTLQKTGYFF